MDERGQLEGLVRKTRAKVFRLTVRQYVMYHIGVH